MNNIAALRKHQQEKNTNDPLLHALSMNHDLIDLEEDEEAVKWYNRRGVKRKLIALAVVGERISEVKRKATS